MFGYCSKCGSPVSMKCGLSTEYGNYKCDKCGHNGNSLEEIARDSSTVDKSDSSNSQCDECLYRKVFDLSNKCDGCVDNNPNNTEPVKDCACFKSKESGENK